MWIILLLYCVVGSVLSSPVDEFRAWVHEGDLTLNDDNLLKRIVPSGYSPQIIGDNRNFQLSSLFHKDNELYRNFNDYVEKGTTSKGLTFNVYDDNLRNAAVSLYRLLRSTRNDDNTNYEQVIKWAKENINSDMLDYARRLTSLYGFQKHEEKFLPPFVIKPNYFINGETIMKAFYVNLNLGKISEDIMKHYQIFYIDENAIVINANYSGWNIPLEGCDKEIKYFIEDVALNSYYYGTHLLHPFWMDNSELSEYNLRHAEHYYFTHQQLYARYLLEKEHLDTKEKSSRNTCEPDYHPYLYYENGMPFPTRSSILGDKLRDDVTFLQKIDIAIKECLQRGLVIMENGTFIRVADDNYIDLMTKLIRANLDSVKSAKVIRSMFGYGSNGYPIDRYNPSPSILHHPHTTLREPVYWYMIQRVLDYFSEFGNSTEPYNISTYESQEFVISGAEFSKLTTTFDYFLINLYKALEGDTVRHISRSGPNIFARQRRLNHLPFTMNFTVESMEQKEVIIRLFLGPQCWINNCWDVHYKFFLLDCYTQKLDRGSNIITWSPETSLRYISIQNNYTDYYESLEENYDIFKFPKNLVFPKGLEAGLNFTVFLMILEKDGQFGGNSNPSQYTKVSYEIDSKPLGFPFHKQAEMYSETAPNYRFFNISIFHLKEPTDKMGHFSSFLD